ncbi:MULTISPECIES: biopolymer transporter ExbD [Sphingomonas]|jgi:biopolymer transport protein ExbD|uniref:Biopolymer transport protein ExbD n=2 Tax=Sphingomonas TaxID=13687 RepID=A0A0A1W5W5_9SPHN|nr:MULTISPECIES: biopolymer transporter ExbD [Sphingomonas]KQO58633.1 biopolymer transporter ExbD [Sphingomonas sp. Leaf257]KTT98715.1 biopolymer transporter ExbD [Sphingomonas yabuuchiae]MBB4608277.1 biopolymer transport protein ExbD [Sphingomonas yabuuchiae]MBN3559946.1 biopolymer transporter ExbD [Sphingomonas yabuuchiae]OMJ31043.1 biopolymer transporter ExbD [Sphingomonas sp. Sph1(2015)]
MAMSVGGDSAEKPMSEINTTPLVDVMLVLLIIFLIAVPVVIQTVPLKLPNVRFDPTTTKPENVSLSVTSENGQCKVYWNLTPVSSDELRTRAVEKLKAEVERLGGVGNITPDQLPEAHIRGDVNTPYRCIGGTIFTMQQAGFARVGFISEPPPGGNPRA